MWNICGLVKRFEKRSRGFRIPGEMLLFALSGVIAFLLRFDFAVPALYLRHLAFAVPIWVVVKLIVLHSKRLDCGAWKSICIADLVLLLVGNAVASLAGALVIVLIAPRGFPRSIYLLDFMICFLMMAGLRVIARLAAEALAREGRTKQPQKNVLIYGAGRAGVTLAGEIRETPQLSYRIRGFIDDDCNKVGLRFAGLPVLGRGADVAAIVKRFDIATILIAIPSAAGSEMTCILELCQAAGVECKTIPGLAEIIQGDALSRQIRDVAVEDLLNRNPVRLKEDLILETIQSKTVLVTGAAGSIGSELCRQIARFSPAAIVGFEIAESPLFEIDRELREKHPHVRFYPEVGSIQNRARLDEVMRRHSPDMVFHAAAYKHVPLMEDHVFEAVENNIFGTQKVAEAAIEHGVHDFVMISSDKAVRPTNIMGTTKRVSEMLLLSCPHNGTRFSAVRFGNVLGSNGSVIPIFKKQIAAGGPVTVTHPEMRRYFMTIPEASQLVLEASAMGSGGEIFVLDMGSPVKIVDLARKLILLSGRKPDRDIKIEFTGIRPGEKLYEELNLLDEQTIPTSCSQINVFAAADLRESDIEDQLEALRRACRRRDPVGIILTLKDLVPEYNPSPQLLRRIAATPNEEHAPSAVRYASSGRMPAPSRVAAIRGALGSEA